MDESDTEDANESDLWARSTAPQSPYTGREIGIGLVIFVVGLVLLFGLPIALV